MLCRSYVADLNAGLDDIPTRGPVSKYSLKPAVRANAPQPPCATTTVHHAAPAYHVASLFFFRWFRHPQDGEESKADSRDRAKITLEWGKHEMEGVACDLTSPGFAGASGARPRGTDGGVCRQLRGEPTRAHGA